MEKSGALELDTLSELAATRRDLDLVKGYCKGYRTRLERIAMGLQFVANAIIRSDIAAATTSIRALLANDGKEARETVGNRSMALAVAVQTFMSMSGGTCCADHSDSMSRSGRSCDQKMALEALDKIKILAPEEFGGVVADTAAAGGRA